MWRVGKRLYGNPLPLAAVLFGPAQQVSANAFLRAGNGLKD